MRFYTETSKHPSFRLKRRRRFQLKFRCKRAQKSELHSCRGFYFLARHPILVFRFSLSAAILHNSALSPCKFTTGLGEKSACCFGFPSGAGPTRPGPATKQTTLTQHTPPASRPPTTLETRLAIAYSGWSIVLF